MNTHWSIHLTISALFYMYVILKKFSLKKKAKWKKQVGKWSKDYIRYYTQKGTQMPHKQNTYSTVLLIRKKQMKTSNPIVYLVSCQTSQSQTYPGLDIRNLSAGNDVSWQKISHTANENMWWYNHFRIRLALYSNFDRVHTPWSSNSFWDRNLENLLHVQQNTQQKRL